MAFASQSTKHLEQTYTSLLEVYMPFCNASGAVHLIGSFFRVLRLVYFAISMA